MRNGGMEVAAHGAWLGLLMCESRLQSGGACLRACVRDNCGDLPPSLNGGIRKGQYCPCQQVCWLSDWGRHALIS